MHTYEELFAQESAKSEQDQDDYVLFFLYSMLQAVIAYSFDPVYSNYHEQFIEQVASKSDCENKTYGFRPLNIYDCKIPEQDKKIKEIFDSPFSKSIWESKSFLPFYFGFMRDVMFIVEPNRMGMNVKKKGACVPVSYGYFKKIISGDRVGGWQFLDVNEKIKTIISPLTVEIITEADKIYKKGGELIIRTPEEREMYIKKYGISGSASYYHTPSLSLAEHKQKIAEKIDRIKGQKMAIELEREEMKKNGYPYQDTHAEYVRFLKNNLADMHFNDYKLKAQLILDIFIPSSLA